MTKYSKCHNINLHNDNLILHNDVTSHPVDRSSLPETPPGSEERGSFGQLGKMPKNILITSLGFSPPHEMVASGPPLIE